MKNLIISSPGAYKNVVSHVNQILEYLDTKYNNPVICLKTVVWPDEEVWEEHKEAYKTDDFDFYILIVQGEHRDDFFADYSDRVADLPGYIDNTILATEAALVDDPVGLQAIKDFFN